MFIVPIDVSQTITTLQSNKCTMTSSTTCIVKEGQRVHVNCSAHSNPPIATAAWQQSGDSVLDLIADRDTSLSHLCDVMTATVGSDDRLPLLSNISLTVLTTCEWYKMIGSVLIMLCAIF